jgi:hypothetical protein
MAQSFLPNKREKRIKKTKEKWSFIIELILKEQRISKIIKENPTIKFIRY